jgi:hypothetical protein
MNIHRKGVTSLTAFALATILFAATSGSATGADSQGSTPWGTWYVTFDAGAGANIPALLTIHRDGTLALSDASDFGGPPFPVQSTPTRGSWVRAGDQMFEGVILYLNADVSTGELVHITRASVSMHFEGNFDHISGTSLRYTFQCPTPFTCPDPLTAEPDSTLPPVPFRGTRLRVEH